MNELLVAEVVMVVEQCIFVLGQGMIQDVSCNDGWMRCDSLFLNALWSLDITIPCDQPTLLMILLLSYATKMLIRCCEERTPLCRD